MKRTDKTAIIIMMVMVAVVLSLFSSMAMAAEQRKTQHLSPRKSESPNICPLPLPPIAAITNCVKGPSPSGQNYVGIQWKYATSGVKPKKLLIRVYMLVLKEGAQQYELAEITLNRQAFNVPHPDIFAGPVAVQINVPCPNKPWVVFWAFYPCNREQSYVFQ